MPQHARGRSLGGGERHLVPESQTRLNKLGRNFSGRVRLFGHVALGVLLQHGFSAGRWLQPAGTCALLLLSFFPLALWSLRPSEPPRPHQHTPVLPLQYFLVGPLERYATQNCGFVVAPCFNTVAAMTRGPTVAATIRGPTRGPI
jgi:hypothetical protein